MLLIEEVNTILETEFDYIYKFLNSSRKFDILKENFNILEGYSWTNKGMLVLSEEEKEEGL